MSPSSPLAGRMPAHESPAGQSRTWIGELPGAIGSTVRISGWLHHRRELKSVAFLLVRDGSGIAQVVLQATGVRAVAADLPRGSAIDIVAAVVANNSAPGGLELHDPVISVLSAAIGELPIELHRPQTMESLPTRLDHAAIALRHPERAALSRVTAAALEGFRGALRAERFIEISTPKIVASAPEGGADVFALDYFGQPAFLAQSPQLYKQIMVGVHERVFETAPAFRAEPHATARHLSQFLSLDAEMGFVGDHRDVMAMVTIAVRGMVDAAGGAGLAEPPSVPRIITEIHFADALDLIGEDVHGEPDLAPAHERWLSDWARETHGSEWLFVTGYPMRKRPFYTHPDPSRPEWSNSFDLLFRGLEVVTGGQRLHRLADYEAALAARGIDPDPFGGYLEAFRGGMPPHGGFALGLERFVARLVGVANIREVTLFPRDRQRLTP